MRKVVFLIASIGLAAVCLVSCDTVETPLAPYAAERPFQILTITESFAPDIQWVGGRAAAVGINRGTRAAMDSTLVWLVRVDGDMLDSPLRVREQNDAEAVMSLGGNPLDSLVSDSVYTFWVADKNALDVGLDQSSVDNHTFASVTDTLHFQMTGSNGGDSRLGVAFSVHRDQTLTEDKYIVTWTPSTLAVSQLGINDASLGSFSRGLIWHIAVENDESAGILPPVTIGVVPPGAVEVQDWIGFDSTGVKTLWVAAPGWNGLFDRNARNYAFFRMSDDNFH